MLVHDDTRFQYHVKVTYNLAYLPDADRDDGAAASIVGSSRLSEVVENCELLSFVKSLALNQTFLKFVVFPLLALYLPKILQRV